MKLINNYIFEKFKISKDIKERPETFYSRFALNEKCLCVVTIAGPQATLDNYLEVAEIINIEKTYKNDMEPKPLTVKILSDIGGLKNKTLYVKYYYDNDDFICFTYQSKIYHLICNYDSFYYFNELKTKKKFEYKQFEPTTLTKETFKLDKMKEEDYNKIEKELTK